MDPLLLLVLSQTPSIIMSIKNSDKAEAVRLKAYDREFLSNNNLSIQQKVTNQAIETLVARKQAIYSLFINDFVEIFGELADIVDYNLQEKLNRIQEQKNIKKK